MEARLSNYNAYDFYWTSTRESCSDVYHFVDVVYGCYRYKAAYPGNDPALCWVSIKGFYIIKSGISTFLNECRYKNEFFVSTNFHYKTSLQSFSPSPWVPLPSSLSSFFEPFHMAAPGQQLYCALHLCYPTCHPCFLRQKHSVPWPPSQNAINQLLRLIARSFFQVVNVGEHFSHLHWIWLSWISGTVA